jgi:Cdc6-like AAA superfamily ATPase
MKWYEKLGYVENPFNTEKGVFIDKSVHLQEPAEELAYNITAGNMMAIEGPPGTGKTTLLYTAIERFRGERNVVYIDCSKKDVDIRKLMQGKYGIIGKLFGILPKKMVLLLDNFSKLSKKDIERVKYYYDNNHIRSVIFAGDVSQLPENVLDRVGGRIIQLKQLSSDDAAELVKNRLGSFEFLPEKITRKIYKKSSGDAKAFLENCTKACEEAVRSGAEMVSEEHINATGGRK